MKSYPVSVTPRADEDVLEQTAYIAHRSQSVQRALAFIDAYEEATRRIAEAPARCALSRHRPDGDETLRQRRIGGFRNHLIFYRFDGKSVKIVRVLHGARDLPMQLRRHQD